MPVQPKIRGRHSQYTMESKSLPCLPVELMREVSNYLEYPSRVALTLTCRDLYAGIEDPNLPAIKDHKIPNCFKNEQKPYSMVDLLEIEKWPCYDSVSSQPQGFKQPVDKLDFFACRYCLKIRPARYFSNAMMKGKRGKHGLGTVQDRSERFCIPCGVDKKIYSPGTYLQFGGAGFKQGFICRRCGSFKSTHYGETQRLNRICRGCDRGVPTAKQNHHIRFRDEFPNDNPAS